MIVNSSFVGRIHVAASRCTLVLMNVSCTKAWVRFHDTKILVPFKIPSAVKSKWLLSLCLGLGCSRSELCQKGWRQPLSTSESWFYFPGSSIWTPLSITVILFGTLLGYRKMRIWRFSPFHRWGSRWDPSMMIALHTCRQCTKHAHTHTIMKPCHTTLALHVSAIPSHFWMQTFPEKFVQE